MRSRYSLAALTAVLLGLWLLGGCAGVRPHPEVPEPEPPAPEEVDKPEKPEALAFNRTALGGFGVTFYYIVDEADGRFDKLPLDTPILDIYGGAIAMVSSEFKRKADIEGSARLADGRVINFAGRSPEGIRWRVVRGAEWGLGAGNVEHISKVEPYKLIPYRSIAVDPKRIRLGSVLYVPRAEGIRLPDGSEHDGYFLAHDVGGAIKGKRLDFFVGGEEDIRNTFTRNGLTNKSTVQVYLILEPEAEEIRSRFRVKYSLTYKPIYRMVWQDLDRTLYNVAAAEQMLDRRIEFFSELAKGTPYVIFCLGEGIDGLYDKDPLLDLGRVDCMTFCEQVLAMAISDSYEDFYYNLQKIRYRDGIIGMTTRNHYTIADWLPNNSWLLKDATEKIGGELCQPMTKTIDRARDLAAIGCSDAAGIGPPQTLTVKYIPKESLGAVQKNLRGGEIVSLIQKQEGIFSSHMGLIVKDRRGGIIFRHGSRSAGEVVDEPFEEYVDKLLSWQSNAGIIFMRVRRDFSLAQGS